MGCVILGMIALLMLSIVFPTPNVDESQHLNEEDDEEAALGGKPNVDESQHLDEEDDEEAVLGGKLKRRLLQHGGYGTSKELRSYLETIYPNRDWRTSGVVDIDGSSSEREPAELVAFVEWLLLDCKVELSERFKQSLCELGYEHLLYPEEKPSAQAPKRRKKEHEMEVLWKGPQSERGLMFVLAIADNISLKLTSLKLGDVWKERGEYLPDNVSEFEFCRVERIEVDNTDVGPQVSVVIGFRTKLHLKHAFAGRLFDLIEDRIEYHITETKFDGRYGSMEFGFATSL